MHNSSTAKLMLTCFRRMIRNYQERFQLHNTATLTAVNTMKNTSLEFLPQSNSRNVWIINEQKARKKLYQVLPNLHTDNNFILDNQLK